eukprot:CAMPEP_0114613470 /NCGR_PEP_ID=MMETSP0168-20121206/5148_1 /TAXON_ID=95228 ORGANISM="Vannella sp., Strain DIVA3 517/6/12" /NCGR_SAMPLE_ID=MMETSP0168 /ASSEMBLY_ACC=CAM_ASM_000044 /LENGTH=567 /DNA_ID=CAMNT_0001824475 /DNA_START=195 /DNA_END=1900 /DNA_ORIENTATION=+
MKRIFGTKKQAPPPPSLTEASEQADVRIQRLDAKISQLDGELRQIRAKLKATKAPGAQNTLKQRAMRILKQKKMYEQQRDQLQSQAFNLEQANFTSQAMQDTVTMVSAMKQANTQMKQQFKAVNLDSIEDLYDDMADLMDEHDMMQDILSRAFQTPEDLDEADLEAELDALGDELLEGEDFDQMPAYMSAEPAAAAAVEQPVDIQLPTSPAAEPQAQQGMEQLLQTFEERARTPVYTSVLQIHRGRLAQRLGGQRGVLLLAEGDQTLHRLDVLALRLVVQHVSDLVAGDLLSGRPLVNAHHRDADGPCRVAHGHLDVVVTSLLVLPRHQAVNDLQQVVRNALVQRSLLFEAGKEGPQVQLGLLERGNELAATSGLLVGVVHELDFALPLLQNPPEHEEDPVLGRQLVADGGECVLDGRHGLEEGLYLAPLRVLLLRLLARLHDGVKLLPLVHLAHEAVKFVRVPLAERRALLRRRLQLHPPPLARPVRLAEEVTTWPAARSRRFTSSRGCCSACSSSSSWGVSSCRAGSTGGTGAASLRSATASAASAAAMASTAAAASSSRSLRVL